MTNPIYSFALRPDLGDDKRFLPVRAYDTDTGWDVRAAQPDRKPLRIEPFQKVVIPLGIRAYIPAGWWMKLVPRSSSFAKKSMHALYGTIDEGWSNESCMILQYIPPMELNVDITQTDSNYGSGGDLKGEIFSSAPALYIEFAERIGQLIPVRRQEMDVRHVSNEEIDRMFDERNASRKTGGFGSTGDS